MAIQKKRNPGIRYCSHAIRALGMLSLLALLVRQSIHHPSSRITTASASALSSVEDTPNRLPTFHIVISSGQDSLTTLNMRCIESIFYHHPTAKLIIHSNQQSGLLSGIQHPKLRPLLQRGYDIQVNFYQPEAVLRSTLAIPISHIDQNLAQEFLNKMTTGELQKEPYWYANEANLMRLCLLYSQGGIYLDTDVVLLNHILAANPALDNVMGRHKDGKKFHNAVMKFTQPGNPFLAAVLDDMFLHYNGTKWGNNGPKAFGRTALSHPEMICPPLSYPFAAAPHAQNPPCHIHPLPNEAFAPVSYKQWDQVCFMDSSPPYEQTSHILANSLVVHFNNKVTGKSIAENHYKRGSLCDHVLNSYCVTCQE
jgi:Alpha 1,4-glycosyltransferase conserved region/Glycosyltransferase sugar-binding region containing DXD motif